MRTTTRVRRTFVASCRPPSPASTTATSTPAVREREQGRRGQGFELRGLESHGLGPDPTQRALEVRLGVPDPDALAPAADVRRDVRADVQPGVGEERLRHARRRRLAVRADDVHRRVGELRVAELGEQRAHPLEPEAVRRPRAERGDPVSCGSSQARAGSARACRARPARRPRARSRRTARSTASSRCARSRPRVARSPPRGVRCPGP